MKRGVIYSLAGLGLSLYLFAVIIRGNGIVFLQAITTEKDFLRWGIAVIVLMYLRDTYARGTEFGEVGILLVNVAMLLTIPTEKLQTAQSEITHFFRG